MVTQLSSGIGPAVHISLAKITLSRLKKETREMLIIEDSFKLNISSSAYY